MTASDWRHADSWKREGKNFLVKVNRHSERKPDDEYSYEGPHRWCVYAYIYPKHPRFALFDGSEMWQPASTALPMHGGPSLLRKHYDDEGKVLSVEVGCDYHHLHDDRYTHMENADQAVGVFNDAEDLYDFLQAEAA
jgi:hypothetical protein